MDKYASTPLFPHPLLARLLERTVKEVTYVPPLAIPTGVHVEARVIILGAPFLSGQLPGVGPVRIDGVYRSRRHPPRQIHVEADKCDGAWRLLGEGEESCGSRVLAGRFPAVCGE
jgi:hypothetical protein